MKKIMILGTSSSVGKSLIVAGLLRALSNRGYKVAPFKSQNMSRVSTTIDGKTISSAQVLQAKAARITPTAEINPILLKPNSDTGSAVFVLGEERANLSATEYFREKEKLFPVVLGAFEHLSKQYDVIVIEGAGSPAEINLRSVDLVNIGLAEKIDAPCILVGDVDRGGVFASLYGTYFILPEADRKWIQGFIVNKFRGDVSLLIPGVEQISEMTGLPSFGVLPYLRDLLLEEEDSAGDAKRGEKNLSEIDLSQVDAVMEAELERLAQAIEAHLDVDGILALAR